MAENKKSFVLYCDLLTSINHLTNEEKGILFQHLLEYVNDMNPVLEDRLLLTAWKPIEIQLKRDLIKFEQVRGKRSEAGKKSAEVRSVKNKTTNLTSVKSVELCLTNPTDNVNENDNVLSSKDNNKEGGWEKVIGLFPPTKHNGLIEASIVWNDLTQKEKQSVMRHLNPYIKNTDEKFMKQIGNYFNERMWENMKPKVTGKDKPLTMEMVEWFQNKIKDKSYDRTRTQLANIKYNNPNEYEKLEEEYKQVKNK